MLKRPEVLDGFGTEFSRAEFGVRAAGCVILL